MPKLYRWVTEIRYVEDGVVKDAVIGCRYNIAFVVAGRETRHLDLDYKTFDEEVSAAIRRFRIKPGNISNDPPPGYKSIKPFDRQRPFTEDDNEEL